MVTAGGDVERSGEANGPVHVKDVPQGPVPPAQRTQRTSFHRTGDRVAVVLIVAVCLLVGVLIGGSSDIRATTSQTGPDQVPPLAAPSVLPPSLGEAWRAPSAATPVPVAVGGSVVTGDGGEVTGRDPLTGDVRWRYARDLPLCTVSSAWSQAIAVYARTSNLLPASDPRAAGGCSEVTSLDGTSGQREYQRNGDAELGTRLLSDGTYVTTTGKRLLDTWRSDLVQTMQYGTVPAIVNPDRQPRSGNPTDQPRVICTYGSVAVAQGRIAVIERCPTDSGDRITVYRPTNTDSDEPSVELSTAMGTTGARVVALNSQFVAVVRPNPSELLVFNATGAQVAEYPIDLPATDFAGDPAGGVVPTSKGPGLVYWFTGSRTIALSGTDFRPLWSVEGTLGPGTVFAGYLLLPVPDGLAVIDQTDGKRIATTPVNRDGYTGPVLMSTIGPMVLEQRGATLVALR